MKIVRESPICGPARAESPTSPKPRATPWVPCSPFVRPVRAKVSINTAPILLPLQGVGIYALIPRALPWAMHLLPFQGAPFRACSFIMCACFATCHLAQNRADCFWIISTLPKSAVWFRFFNFETKLQFAFHIHNSERDFIGPGGTKKKQNAAEGHGGPENKKGAPRMRSALFIENALTFRE